MSERLLFLAFVLFDLPFFCACLGLNVVPTVDGEDSTIALFMQLAQLQDVGVEFVGVVEAVVGLGQAFVVANHQRGAEFVVSFADRFYCSIGRMGANPAL